MQYADDACDRTGLHKTTWSSSLRCDGAILGKSGQMPVNGFRVDTETDSISTHEEEDEHRLNANHPRQTTVETFHATE
jgi:hypothetical protein